MTGGSWSECRLNRCILRQVSGSVLQMSAGRGMQRPGAEQTKAVEPVLVTGRRASEMWVWIVCTLHTLWVLSQINLQGIQCRGFLFRHNIEWHLCSYTQTFMQSESLSFSCVYLPNSQKHWLTYSLICMQMLRFFPLTFILLFTVGRLIWQRSLCSCVNVPYLRHFVFYTTTAGSQWEVLMWYLYMKQKWQFDCIFIWIFSDAIEAEYIKTDLFSQKQLAVFFSIQRVVHHPSSHPVQNDLSCSVCLIRVFQSTLLTLDSLQLLSFLQY